MADHPNLKTIEKHLQEFAEYFIDEFETRIELYRKILEEKNEEKNKNSSIITGSKQAVSGGISFATGIPFLGAVIGAIYEQGGKKIVNTIEEKRNKTEASSLYDLIYRYKEESASYRKLLIEVCYEIFYSFECQFSSVTSQKGGDTRAMLKMAKTCVTKILNYLINSDSAVNEETIFLSVIIQEEGAIKKYVDTYFKVGRTVYTKKNGAKFNTLNLLTKCGIFEKDSLSFYSKNDLDPQTYGYRRVSSYDNFDIKNNWFLQKCDVDQSYCLELSQKGNYVKKILERLSKRDPKLMEERFKATFNSLQVEILSQLALIKKEDLSNLEEVKTALKDLQVQILNGITLYYVKNKNLLDLSEKNHNNHHVETVSILNETNSSLGLIDSNLKETLVKVSFIHDHVKSQENKPIFFNCFPPKNFIGRHNELNELQSAILDQNIIIINGPRGVGKTELVKKFVQNKKMEGISNIIWLNSDSNEILIQSFKDIALMLSFNMADATNLTLIGNVFKYFKDKNTIFVFDNCRTNTLFLNNLADLVEIGSSKIILTTTNVKNWNVTYHVVSVSKWPPNEAAEYVNLVLSTEILNNITFNHDDCLKLAEFHNFLPYSLFHATSFIVQLNSIHKKPFTIDDYIKKYGENEISEPILEQNDDDSDDEPLEKHVYKKIEAETKRFQKRVSAEAGRVGDQISDGAAHVEEQVRTFFKKLF